MFASLPSLSIKPLISGFGKRSKSRAEVDLDALLSRMRHRWYPETIPALASYWLRTIYSGGYSLRQWKELNQLLKLAIEKPLLDNTSQEALGEIQSWIQESIIDTGKEPKSRPPSTQPVRTSLSRDRLMAFTVRLLNEWLPAEVARLLVEQSESTFAGPNLKEEAIPVLAVARALEGMLLRERLSPATLEMLLDPELLSSEHVYPSDMEVLRDVVLWLLRRTQAPIPAALPATLLCLVPKSHLPADFQEAVRNAFLVARPTGDEVHVPIAPAWAMRILKEERVQIGSVLVTADGRLWESESLHSGQDHVVVYRAVGRLVVDYTQDHAGLRIPWPEPRVRWSNGYVVPEIQLFGREWRVSSWEMDAERTWVHLVFCRVRPVSEILPAEVTKPWRLRPASVDISWAALENALATSLAEGGTGPIEQLRQADLIPLGRAIIGLAKSVTSRRRITYESVETQLNAIRYMESGLISTYGRVPWKLLPAKVRDNLLTVRRHPALTQLLQEVFEGLPDTIIPRADQAEFLRPTPPPHAA